MNAALQQLNLQRDAFTAAVENASEEILPWSTSNRHPCRTCIPNNANPMLLNGAHRARCTSRWLKWAMLVSLASIRIVLKGVWPYSKHARKLRPLSYALGPFALVTQGCPSHVYPLSPPWRNALGCRRLPACESLHEDVWIGIQTTRIENQESRTGLPADVGGPSPLLSRRLTTRDRLTMDSRQMSRWRISESSCIPDSCSCIVRFSYQERVHVSLSLLLTTLEQEIRLESICYLYCYGKTENDDKRFGFIN